MRRCVHGTADDRVYAAGAMDFDRLRAFVWTLEEGGITAAARRLCRSQPAVTRMLQALEDQVGTVLIDRRARPMKPTAAGEKVLEYAREILEAASRLTDGRFRGGTFRPSLRLGVSRSLFWQLRDPRFVTPVPPIADTDFSIASGWSPALYRRFARGEFDAAVVLLPRAWTPDVPCAVELLRAEPLVVIAPRAKSAPARRRATIADLHGERWVLNPDGCGFRHALARGLAATGHRLRVQFELDAAPQEHLAMVAAGIGCSVVPLSVVTQNLKAAQSVQQLVVAGLDFELGVWATSHLRDRAGAASFAAFADIFRRGGHLAAAGRTAASG